MYTARLCCYLRSAVFTHIDLHKLVNILIQILNDFVGRLMKAVRVCLPMVQFYLFAHCEKKMNVRGGHRVATYYYVFKMSRY